MLDMPEFYYFFLFFTR